MDVYRCGTAYVGEGGLGVGCVGKVLVLPGVHVALSIYFQTNLLPIFTCRH